MDELQLNELGVDEGQDESEATDPIDKKPTKPLSLLGETRLSLNDGSRSLELHTNCPVSFERVAEVGLWLIQEMKETKLKIRKPFWALIRCGDPEGYDTGKAYIETIFIQTDTATELNNLLGEGSLRSGESMGDYVFKVLAISNENLNELENYERCKE